MLTRNAMRMHLMEVLNKTFADWSRKLSPRTSCDRYPAEAFSRMEFTHLLDLLGSSQEEQQKGLEV